MAGHIDIDTWPLTTIFVPYGICFGYTAMVRFVTGGTPLAVEFMPEYGPQQMLHAQ